MIYCCLLWVNWKQQLLLISRTREVQTGYLENQETSQKNWCGWLDHSVKKYRRQFVGRLLMPTCIINYLMKKLLYVNTIWGEVVSFHRKTVNFATPLKLLNTNLKNKKSLNRGGSSKKGCSLIRSPIIPVCLSFKRKSKMPTINFWLYSKSIKT